MQLSPLAALILTLAPSAFAGSARVELVPELGLAGAAPAASVGAAPLQLSQASLIPALGLSAPALPPSAILAAQPSALLAAQPSPVVAAAVRASPAKAVPSDRPALIQTLALPALDVSTLGLGDSAGAAEKDFNARAQLGAPTAAGGAEAAIPRAAAPRENAFVRLLKAVARVPAKPAAPTASGSLDASGALMKAALVKAAAANGEPILLGFVPTPKSLKVLAEEHREFMLYRRRSDGAWLLHGGKETFGLANSNEDWDVGLHNHPMIPGLSAYTARFPSPEDFRAAEGIDARVGVVTPGGVVEWNPVLPKTFWGRLTATAFGRAATGVFMPYFYEGHVKRLGLGFDDMPWRRVTQAWIERRTPAPLSAELVIDRVIPELVAAELPVIAAKLGVDLTAARKADVLARTNGYRMYWHSATTYKDHPDHMGIPDGHFRPDFGIRLMVKSDWRKLKDLSTNFRPLFAHEYVHLLQNEGHISNRYGAEIAATAVEVLRAVELVGLDEVRAGRSGTVHLGMVRQFDGGRDWARTGFAGQGTPYQKGALAGAAYEAAQITGRPEAAWEFLNLVIAGRDALEPVDAWARVVGPK